LSAQDGWSESNIHHVRTVIGFAKGSTHPASLREGQETAKMEAS
jgi:hypothetical protein